jgi:hypothetical protein
VLYSGANGTGTATGTIDTTFAGGGANIMTTAMAQPIATVAVTPGSDSLPKGGTIQLFAAAEDANSEFVFESAQPKWSTDTVAVANVNSTGFVTAGVPGQATISASLSGVIGTTTIVTTGISKGTWTIMVYMNADNNLDMDSINNELQMEQIAQTPTSQTRIVIQWKLSDTPQSQSTDVSAHPFNGTQRFLEVQGGRQLVQDLGTGVDMGSATTLQSFVNWTVQNYPAQHYALVMWDHGNGWLFKTKRPKHAAWRGISYDNDTGDHIDVNQIAPAISPNHLDILAFDACQMQMLEVMDEVKGVANYMVGSENNTPEPGYPYNTAFSQFFANPNGAVPTLAGGIVKAYINNYEDSPTYGSLPLSHSVVDLSKITALVGSLNTFSENLLSASNIGATTQAVRAGMTNYAVGEGYYYYDLGTIANRFSASSAPSAVTSSAASLAQAEAAAVLLSEHNTGGSPPVNLSPDSTGISIDFSTSGQFAQYASSYSQLLISDQTHWGTVLSSGTVNP